MAKAKQLNVKAFGMAAGLVWGAAVLLLGLFATPQYGMPFVQFIGSLYPGYAPTVQGAFIGGFWGFVDGGIGALVFAWLYNKFTEYFK